MSTLFRLLGVLVACYAALAVVRGEVYAKSGPWGRTFRRDEHSLPFWGAVVAYSTLSLALFFVF